MGFELARARSERIPDLVFSANSKIASSQRMTQIRGLQDRKHRSSTIYQIYINFRVSFSFFGINKKVFSPC